MIDRLPPYAQLLGLSAERDGNGAPLLVMPFGKDVLGRPRFLHGGAISGLMEMAAIVALYDALGMTAAATSSRSTSRSISCAADATSRRGRGAS